jgi:hypothetical protein
VSETEHRDYVKSRTKHKTPKGGCLVRCSPHYAEKNEHSWRGQARKRAKKQNVIPYPEDFKFKQNAHHIIPVSVLWRTIEEVTQTAGKTKQGEMLDLVIDGLLTEKYNINYETNMIILATRSQVAKKLGLPLHLRSKAWNHPDYSAQVEMLMKSNVDPQYSKLANAVRDEKHGKEKETPKVKNKLNRISEGIYDAIIAVGTAAKMSPGQSQSTLDDVADSIIDALFQ